MTIGLTVVLVLQLVILTVQILNFRAEVKHRQKQFKMMEVKYERND